MSDDSETVEDTKEGSLTEVTDDSCTVKFIEILPIGSASDYYRTSGFTDRVVEVKLEDLQQVKHEPADENDSGYPNYSVKQELADECKMEGPCCTIPVQVKTTFRIQLM